MVPFLHGYSDLEMVFLFVMCNFVTLFLCSVNKSALLSLLSLHHSVARVTSRGTSLAYLSEQGEKSCFHHVASTWEMNTVVSGPILSTVHY